MFSGFAVAGSESRDSPDFGSRIIRADAEPHNWLSTGRDYHEQHYSPLTEIDAKSVARLGLAWYHQFDTDRGQEATPLVIDGVLYVSTAWSKVYAFDAASGRQLWAYDPAVDPADAVRYCCDVVNRGVAAWDGRIFVGALDGRLIALDAKTGAEQWSVMTVRPKSYGSITGAPRVVKGKVIIGNGGADFGERGYVSAYAADTGKQLWRFYTVPGDPSKPFENSALEGAAKTWSGEWWKQGGGGTVWDAIAYDPDADLLYIGVGNGYPGAAGARSPKGGDNLYLSSIMALRPDTGEYVWHYQETPAETWDYTATQPMVLADLAIGGTPRKVLMQAPKNGFFYVLDRLSGELLSAEKYVEVRWATHVDLRTGRPVEVPLYREQPVLNMPSLFGAHNFQPMAYSPQTGLVYLPVNELHYSSTGGLLREGNNQQSLGDTAMFRIDRKTEEEFPTSGTLVAWDPVAGKPRWRIEHAFPVNGGTLATAGGLVFQGTADGLFAAYDARTGTHLWQSEGAEGIIAAPVSYAVAGVQYIAVLAGYGGAAGVAYGYASPDRPRLPGRLYVFRLDGKASAPRQTWPAKLPLDLSKVAVPADTSAGEGLFRVHCMRCHGIGADGGILPDLRYTPLLLDAVAWRSVVIDGVLAQRGMVSFAGYMGPPDAEAIRGFLLAEARRTQAAPPPAH